MAYQKNHPELNANIKPSCPQLLANSVYHRLSPVRDQHGRFVYFAHFGDFSQLSLFRIDVLAHLVCITGFVKKKEKIIIAELVLFNWPFEMNKNSI